MDCVAQGLLSTGIHINKDPIQPTLWEGLSTPLSGGLGSADSLEWAALWYSTNELTN